MGFCLFVFWLHCLHCCTRAFSSCSEQGLLSSCCVWASHYSSFPTVGALAQSVVVGHGLSCSVAGGIFQGSNSCPLHWEVDSFLKFYLFLNWKIIALQYCAGFIISITQPQIYTCPLRLEPPFHLPPHLIPLGCHRAPGLRSLRRRANSHWLSILHMVMYMFPCCSLNSSHPLLPLLSKVCLLRLCLHCCPQIGPSVLSFLISYISFNKWYLFFWTYFTLCNRLWVHLPY